MPNHDIIAIGASTGGITALQTIVADLPSDLEASLFIVLHTTGDRPGMLPDVLNVISKVPALYAVHNAPILPGRIYLAPGGRHLKLERGRTRLTIEPRENRHRPAIDMLFRSAAHAYGSRVVGVILTGHLDDGTAGLDAIKERGGVTIVQDPDDAVAPSMPRSAVENVDVDYVLRAAEIGKALVELTNDIREAPEKTVLGPTLASSSESAAFTCPDCGGPMKELEQGNTTQYRCLVGHIFSPEAMLEAQGEAVERALWAGVRSLEEHADFTTRLAKRSTERKRPQLAERFNERAMASRENARVLRELLDHTTEIRNPAVEEVTGTEG